MIDEDELVTACTFRGGPEGAGEKRKTVFFGFVSQASNMEDSESLHFQTEGRVIDGVWFIA